MDTPTVSQFGKRLALVLFFAAPAATSVHAATSYDGRWSVIISTEKGDCDRAYRYPVEIQNGKIVYSGDGGFQVSGQVSGGGAVRVQLSRGQASASASGRLTSGSGGGKWVGKGSTAACAGSWTAERRS